MNSGSPYSRLLRVSTLRTRSCRFKYKNAKGRPIAAPDTAVIGFERRAKENRKPSRSLVEQRTQAAQTPKAGQVILVRRAWEIRHRIRRQRGPDPPARPRRQLPPPTHRRRG